MQRTIVALAALATLGLVHCKKTPEPTGSSSGSLLAAGSAAKPTTPAVAPSALPLGVTWVDPEGWRRDTKPSPMRKATFIVPRASGDQEDGELAVFYFGAGEGGSTEANVDRWVKQFKDPKPAGGRRADRTANGLVQHTVEIDEGTFSSGMPGQPSKPKAGYALIGAIVDAPTGAYFFKLTGPKATVAAARERFYQFLDTVKPTS